MQTPINPPDMPREQTVSVAEHEVLLSFTNDVDAEMFSDWWNISGLSAFLDWVTDNIDEY